MLKMIQKMMVLIFKDKEPKHEVTVVDEEKMRLRKDLATLKIQLREYQEEVHTADLWMRKAEKLQDKLSVALGDTKTFQEKLTAALGHTKVLEGVLEESNKTIEALNLAIELREKEETEGLQSYIDELEAEIEEAVGVIQKYGLELRKA
tara:strand:- start:60 stop:506 length:447 start_codon:yes stop_codon:yes gene_type:complete